jgi:hypothetical protein
VALIITLIMLSVITFLAVTFLVLSQRERNAVTTTTDQAQARITADTATERAKVELLAPMLAFTNDQIGGVIVSTNYINPRGFDPAAPNVIDPFTAFNTNPTNVNYDRLVSGAVLTPAQRLQNLANLLYNPRPPVIMTNTALRTNEFRYYLDLNRNGMFDTNGYIPELDKQGRALDVNGNVAGPGSVTNYVWCVGDPEWVGILEHPEWPHSSSNRFVGRYAFIAVPEGKTLDLNYIHNAAKRNNSAAGADNFLRNEGVGSWEINLAAFLADLNTNFWYYSPGFAIPTYIYDNTNLTAQSQGPGFIDSSYLLRYRYGGSFLGLNSFFNCYGLNGDAGVRFGGVDEYSDGDLLTALALRPDTDNPTLPWSGANDTTNANHFFTHQELFDRGKTSPGLAPLAYGFTNRLLEASTNLDTYNRYTFYRMMAQMGLDTAPEQGKININHRNIDDFGNIIPGMETNFISWTAINFFTNAAERIVRMNTELWQRENNYDYTNTFGIDTAFGVNANTNGIVGIPVYVPFRYLTTTIPVRLQTNEAVRYTPSIHRLLQVVANIYDSTTNQSDLSPYPYLPHTYRPIFRRVVNTNADDNIYIVGYREVHDAQLAGIGGTAPRMVDLQLRNGPNGRLSIPVIGTPFNLNPGIESDEPMVYGIPIVIGAKKGLPNMNKFGLQNDIQVTRKLQFRRQPAGPVNQTNQVYELGISNMFAAQAWNSYAAAYPRPLQAVVAADATLSLTNEFGTIMNQFGTVVSNVFPAVTPAAPLVYATWPGYQRSAASPVSFKIPLFTNNMFLTNSFYVQDGTPGGTHFASEQTAVWDQANTYRVPHFWLNLRTRLRFILVDTSLSPSRIVDYVNLDSPEAPLDIMQTVMNGAHCENIIDGSVTDGGILWCTNRYPDRNSTLSITNPAVVTYGILNQMLICLGSVDVPPSFWKDFSKAGDKGDSITKFLQWFSSTNTPNSYDAPFQPTRRLYQYVAWEANDPLVHYTIPDLTDLLVVPQRFELDHPKNSSTNNLAGQKRENRHYLPWPSTTSDYKTSPQTQFETALKDPGVRNSDGWNFPTNMLPNVGWLGRVHRGTPWQTVYMKSEDLAVTNFPVTMTNAITWASNYVNAAVRWRAWSGDANTNDAFNTRPAQDRLLFDLFTTAINGNATRGQLSVNQSELAAWSGVLSGTVLAIDNLGGSNTIQPAALGPFGNSPIEKIVRGINRTRGQTNLVNGDLYPQKLFAHLGDVLSVPELTESSPYLNTNVLRIPNTTISDEVLERIPQQVMSLLTLRHPRFVIYAYGQTLRPAPNSIVTASGPFFQMCTNYQVTAECVTRTVVDVEGLNATNNSPQIVTEEFNPLPPD